MGRWGAGIFDDDMAADLKAKFESMIEDGKKAHEALNEIIESEKDFLDDADEEELSAIYYAIATLQLEHNLLTEEVRTKTLQLIDFEIKTELSGDSKNQSVIKRKRILENLHQQLQSTL